MNNNPLATVIRNAFIKNVIQQPAVYDDSAYSNTIGNILKHKRIYRFEKAINQFLQNCGQAPVPHFELKTSEKNLLTFSLQLSGYIRDAQKALNKMSNAHACDPDLIKLYDAAAEYSVACNNQIEDSKYIFHEHCDYQIWKVNIQDKLANATFDNDNIEIDPKRRNLFLFMPFHIRGNQEELRHWSTLFLNEAIDNKEIFGPQVDVYLIHFPVEQPRGEKFSLTLKTIKDPQNYYTKADMDLIKKHFHPFLGNNIKIDKQNKITECDTHSAEKFNNQCNNITILGYCAAGAHAHRCINAFSKLASQIYPQQTTHDALKNIHVINFAFLAIQEENKYSSIHFMNNYANDHLRKEPFVKMFTPEEYDKYKYTPSIAPSRITVQQNGQRIIEAFNLPEDFAVYDSENRKQNLANLEHGHHMAVITKQNANSRQNYPMKRFVSTLENTCLRTSNHSANIQNLSVPYILQHKKQSIR